MFLFFCIHAVPAFVDIAQLVTDSLDDGEVSFFEYMLPVSGMTIHLDVFQGTLILYASDQIRNPSGALYDYRVQTSASESADVYIGSGVSDPTVTSGTSPLRRHFASDDIHILYVTIEGLGNGRNTFQLDTAYGNTQCKCYTYLNT